MKARHTCLLIACLLLGFHASATVWEDLDLLRKRYSGLTAFQAEHTYTLVDAEQPSQVISMLQGSMAFSEAGYRYTLGKQAFLSNSRYAWAVYEDIGRIVVQELNGNVVPNKGGVWDFQQLDSMLRTYQLLTFTKPDLPGHRALRFDFHGHPLAEYQYIDIEFDPATHTVHQIKMAYQYSASHYGLADDYVPMLIVAYRNQQFDTPLAPSLFSEQAYFRQEAGSYIGKSPAYTHYQIITPYE